MQVDRFDERIDHMDRVVLAYPILQAFRQERQLGSVRTFNEASHPYPPSGNGGIVADSWLFTQPGSQAALRDMAVKVSYGPVGYIQKNAGRSRARIQSVPLKMVQVSGRDVS